MIINNKTIKYIINNNKLTLKALKQELDQLKQSKANSPSLGTETHKSSVTHDIKNSYIQNLHMKSTMFTLWLITTILVYAHKIPYIGRIVSLLSLWYGRTTWWKILIKIRKLFILFNALIGVYVVFKTVGFSSDNIFDGFAGMGHTYIELLFNFTKRLFNWIFDLFDYKIVPNLPNTPPSSKIHKYLWSPRGLDLSWNNPLPDFSKVSKDLLNSPFNININSTSTSRARYKDLSTWLWIGGIVTIGAISLTTVYLS
jgi:hypothetical protein